MEVWQKAFTKKNVSKLIFFLLFSFCDKNKKPTVFVSTYEEGIKRVLEGNYAFLMESTMLDYNVQRDCNLTQIGGNLLSHAIWSQ